MAASMEVETKQENDFIEEQVLFFFNSEFGDNVKSLPKAQELLTEIKSTKASLEQQLSLASSEVPSQIEFALHEAEAANLYVTEITTKQDKLRDSIRDHVKQAEPIVYRLSELTTQARELENYVQYLDCISKIEELSSNLQSALMIESTDRAVSEFVRLVDIYTSLQNSSCQNLVTFLKETILHWYKILKTTLSKEFEDIFTVLKWPFVSPVSKAPSTPSGNVNMMEIRGKFSILFSQLLKLRPPEELEAEPMVKHPTLSVIPGWRNLLLPLDLLLRPLRKRFRYHFYGKKQTNSYDKPEWYLTQVLGWMRDHAEFLMTTVQPILRKEGLSSVDARIEFTRGLVMLTMEKMVTDIPELLYDEHMFSHFIDEILSFDKELRSTHSYPDSEPSCLHVLCHKEEAFEKWINIERKFAVEKMDAMLSSTSAWESQYKDMPDVDETKSPECAESFMTLLLTMTDRYKTLPYQSDKLRFLDLQLELLDDFRIRLLQVMKGETAAGYLNERVTAILNTFQYIVDILREWSDTLFFLQLQYYRSESVIATQSKHERKNVEGQKSSLAETGSSSTQLNSTKQLYDESKLETLEGTVFDEIVDLFEHIKKESMHQLIGDIVREVKARSKPYRKDKWISLPSQKDFVSLALSNTACNLFIILKDQLHLAEQLLCKTLFFKVWQSLAEELNAFIYLEVILANHFNDGGAAQIHHDMNRNMFPLFGEYTHKPENYFKDVKEACLLLTMSTGSAMLLKELLYHSLHEPDSTRKKKEDPVNALQEAGIFKLKPEDAELVLSLRTNLKTGL